ncbi:MAG: Glu-tRNA(Gln) amidotransferase subunit GatE [Candidatus Thorarchaeota archaeon]
MRDDSRYEELGLMVGLELHQQLDTKRKLFCHCPTTIREDAPHGTFIRRLRPTKSEMGEIDPAALFEFQRKKRFCYEYYNDSTCLVEADEEPPHDISSESIDICLTLANFLGSEPVDEVHSMRKVVIDGSNTTGFQRTVIVALGGKLVVGGKEIGIQTIAVEEDAARKIADDDKNNTRIYRLDRLGIPLIEIATAPDIRSPSEAQEVALAIGLLLRATGKVKRGIGTIRQDVNVSIKGGAITEIKGLQQLDMLAMVVEYEALRQENLLRIRDELVTRGITPECIEEDIHDITTLFANSESKVIKGAIKSGGAVYGVKLPGFAGLVGREVQPDRRLGTELSDYAKFWGNVGGIFHTDELPKYGITENDVSNLRKHFNASDQDAIVIVAAQSENCQDALDAVVKRAREAAIGVPAETRMPLPEGTTKYARPRPGAQRMYPETDVRPEKITVARLKSIERSMPETLEKREQRFIKDHGLSTELASQIIRSQNLDLYEFIVREVKVDPTLVAVTLENTLVSLSRDGIPVDSLTDDHFEELFLTVAEDKVSTDAIPEILTFLSKNPEASMDDALNGTGLGKVDQSEIVSVIKRVVAEREEFIREQGERAIGGLMGLIMNELRGKADGKIVRDLIAAEVKKILG